MMECFAEATRIFEADGQGSGAANEDIPAASEGEQHHVVELKITGYNFYSLSIFHPECAAAAWRQIDSYDKCIDRYFL